ncbi:DUF1694 domain-containing protein [Streptococcus pluranimalium]|uniref:DUF1694 domain-containing protein n=1 Tax=Streptococcus pluranimalium TaxID=82348 RepID=UPI0039FBA841
MSDLNQKIVERAAGNRVLNPDEQRYYLGTFGERVLVSIKLEDMTHKKILELFSTALNKEMIANNALKVIISSKVNDDKQLTLLKIAKDSGISATIIDDKQSTSPFGVIILTDHAVNRSETDLLTLLEEKSTEPETKNPKKSFFKRLLGKS